jgi:hypothetical protein
LENLPQKLAIFGKFAMKIRHSGKFTKKQNIFPFFWKFFHENRYAGITSMREWKYC